MSSNTELYQDKIDLAISGLEKLKQEVASVEAKYRILNEHYTIICDEALTRINEARFSSKENGDPIISQPAQNNMAEPELIIITNLENDIAPDNTHYDDYNQEQFTETQKPSQQQGTPPIDYMANYIEIGLDKIGDALVYPFIITARIYKKITGTGTSK